MYEVIFYEDKNGQSELQSQFDILYQKSISNKDARIQYREIIFCIELLSRCGAHLPNGLSKYLGDEIWELRPGHNRILFFHFQDGKYVLLHMFKKKTQKTPKREIQKAKKEREEYCKRWRKKQ